MSSLEGRISSSKRRSLVQSASKKFSYLGQPKPRRERLPDNEPKSEYRISKPFNFRDLSNDSSSTSTTATIHTKVSTSRQPEQINPRSCASPLDKPLPSLPVAAIVSGSPVKVKRSLIDAQEKPLRRSLSPQQQVAFEDWPTLSPQKQFNSTKKMPTPMRPSMGESLVERIKMLNLNDDTATSSSPLSSPDVVATQPMKVPPHQRSPVPMVRQNRTSELRLRLTAGNLEDPKTRKTNLPAPLGNISGNVTTRARPMKQSVDHLQGRVAVTHSRSRSRHRVTAQGSPFVTALQGDKSDGVTSDRESSLILDPNQVDTNFSGAGAEKSIKNSEVDTGKADQRGSPSNSALPIPKHQIQVIANDDKGAEITSQSQPCEPSQSARNNESSDTRIKPDGQQKLIASLPSTTSQPGRCTIHYQKDSLDSHSETAIETPDERILNEGAQHQPSVSLDDNSCTETSDSLVDNGDFEVKPPPKHRLQCGPILRISPLADEVLLGIGSGIDGASPGGFASKKDDTGDLDGPPPSDHSQFPNQSDVKHPNFINHATKRPSTHDGKLMQRAIQPIEHREISENYSIARKPVYRRSSLVNKQNITNTTTTYAPPVEPGAPKDDSPTAAWPFKESAIAPFKTSITPQHSRAAPELTTSDCNSGLSTQIEASPGRSVHSRYNMSEALTEIQPLEGTTSQQHFRTANNVDSHEAAFSGPSNPAFPRRNSSLHYSSHRLTGLRTPSTRAPTIKIDETFISRSPTTATPRSTLVPRPQYMKSFIRSTNNLSAAPIANGNPTDKSLSSPLPAAGSVTTGKGVIGNIRGLFHKHSNLHTSLHGSIRRPLRTDKDGGSSLKSPISPVTTHPPMSSQLPRSPQVKGTSSVAGRRVLRSTSRGFPTNRIVRPFASSNPPPSEVQSPVTIADHDGNERNSTAQTNIKAPEITFETTALEPREIQSATALVYHLLGLVQDEVLDHRKKKELIELSKSLVTILTLARNIERNLEEAKIAAAKCEMKAIDVRRELSRVERLVRALLEHIEG